MPRVLIVEDELPIAEMYRYKLEQAGHEVKCANNGLEGFQAAGIFLPELILLDLRMPVMNGQEMLEKLRATAWGAPIKVIILTNISRDEAPSNLRFLHIDRYAIKAHHTPKQIAELSEEVLQKVITK